jgi:hypothetical protein
MRLASKYACQHEYSLILEGDHDKAHALNFNTLMSLWLSLDQTSRASLSGNSSEILCILHRAIRILTRSYDLGRLLMRWGHWELPEPELWWTSYFHTIEISAL